MERTIKRLKDLRESHNLTQASLCESIHITQQQYSKYENGKSHMPADVLVRLANLYDVTTDYLLGRTNCKEENKILSKELFPNLIAGEVLTDMLMLNEEARKRIVEQIALWKLKSKCKCRRGK